MQNVTLKAYKKELFMDAEIFKGLTKGNHNQKIGGSRLVQERIWEKSQKGQKVHINFKNMKKSEF